jgi:heme oxygenase
MSFPHRLRAETADLHVAVEAVADLPGSVQTLADYGDLLSAFYGAHVQFEGALAARDRDQGWRALGIDIAGHGPLDLLTEDLSALGLTPDPGPQTDLVLTSPAEALGCLCVVEGSAIGRRALAPLLKEGLGDIPSAFFDGAAIRWHGGTFSVRSRTGRMTRPTGRRSWPAPGRRSGCSSTASGSAPSAAV